LTPDFKTLGFYWLVECLTYLTVTGYIYQFDDLCCVHAVIGCLLFSLEYEWFDCILLRWCVWVGCFSRSSFFWMGHLHILLFSVCSDTFLPSRSAFLLSFRLLWLFSVLFYSASENWILLCSMCFFRKFWWFRICQYQLWKINLEIAMMIVLSFFSMLEYWIFLRPICIFMGDWIRDAGPDSSRAYFWPAVNERPNHLWQGYFLTQTEDIFFDPKGKNWKILHF